LEGGGGGGRGRRRMGAMGARGGTRRGKAMGVGWRMGKDWQD